MRRAFRLRLASCAAAWLVGWGAVWAQAPAAPTAPSLKQPGRIAGAPLTDAELAALPPDQGVPPHVPLGQRCGPSPDQFETEAYLKRLQLTPAVDLNVFEVLLMQRALPMMEERLRAGASPTCVVGRSIRACWPRRRHLAAQPWQPIRTAPVGQQHCHASTVSA